MGHGACKDKDAGAAPPSLSPILRKASLPAAPPGDFPSLLSPVFPALTGRAEAESHSSLGHSIRSGIRNTRCREDKIMKHADSNGGSFVSHGGGKLCRRIALQITPRPAGRRRGLFIHPAGPHVSWVGWYAEASLLGEKKTPAIFKPDWQAVRHQ